MIKIGKWNVLKVVDDWEIGLKLEGEEYGEILIPRRYVPEGVTIGEELEVFLYCDSEDRLIATTEIPLAHAGEFAILKVVDTTPIGAFLDWGLPKELFVPMREQTTRMKEGEEYLVHIYVDPASERIVASTRINRFVPTEPVNYGLGEKVEIIVANETDLGFNAIINRKHLGILYKNEVFQPLKYAQIIEGYVKKVRDDGKIDLTLNKPIGEQIPELESKILTMLDSHNGFLPLTDKSPPEVIYDAVGASKKSYKKAIGALYKKKLITLESYGIRKV